MDSGGRLSASYVRTDPSGYVRHYRLSRANHANCLIDGRLQLRRSGFITRAVSKKKREVLDEERAHFVSGSLRQGFNADEANHVYDMIVRFADYGFPRAHATAYGVLAFQTAYLKAHYPIYFMASMLTAVMGNHRKVAE